MIPVYTAGLFAAAAAAGMINGGHMLDEVNKLVGITPFIVVPSNELYEMIVEHDAGGCIEYGSSLIVIEIGRDNSVLGVSDDAGEFGALLAAFITALISS